MVSSNKSPAMNEILPQPPPDAPMPPPSEAALRSQRWRNWIVGVGVLCMFAVAMLPMTVRQSKCRGKMSESVSNARQMGLALDEFENEYGSLPNDSTRRLVEAKNPGSTIPLGTASSNDYFRQLIAAEISTSEVMFYGKMPDTHKPDNVMIGSRALEKGECSFAYVVGCSFKSTSRTPVALFPLVKGKLLFDYKTCKKFHYGSATVLFTDNSVTTLPVDKSGHVFINGKDLFDPSQPFWGGKVPVVKWPE